MWLGDARSGKLPDHITAFGRALRRAGVPVDSSRMAMAITATHTVGVERKDDLLDLSEQSLQAFGRDGSSRVIAAVSNACEKSRAVLILCRYAHA